MAVFTHGHYFVLNDDNTGSTGECKIAQNIPVDRVLIYYPNDEINTNTLYIANYGVVKPAAREGGYNVQLTHFQYIGTTSSNWMDFAEDGQNLIRYLF